jgi:serine/threonine protein kinase
MLFLLEIFSWADLPWSGLTDLDAMKSMQRLVKLSRPEGCPDEMYQIMMLCWKLDRNVRATPQRLITIFNEFVASKHGINSEGRHQEHAHFSPSLTWPEVDITSNKLTYNAQQALIDTKSSEVLLRFSALEMDPANMRYTKELGKGEFGTVSLAVYQQTPTQSIEVAVKTLLPTVSAAEQSQFEYEAKLLSALNHRHIVRVLGVCFNHQPHFMALELMRGGDLRSHLQEREQQLRGHYDTLTEVCIQVADAMDYLSARKVVHRDLAARLGIFS